MPNMKGRVLLWHSSEDGQPARIVCSALLGEPQLEAIINKSFLCSKELSSIASRPTNLQQMDMSRSRRLQALDVQAMGWLVQLVSAVTNGRFGAMLT